jgi:hypothetical protein
MGAGAWRSGKGGDDSDPASYERGGDWTEECSGEEGRRLTGPDGECNNREKEAGAAGGESGARAHGPALGGEAGSVLIIKLIHK